MGTKSGIPSTSFPARLDGGGGGAEEEPEGAKVGALGEDRQDEKNG